MVMMTAIKKFHMKLFHNDAPPYQDLMKKRNTSENTRQ